MSYKLLIGHLFILYVFVARFGYTNFIGYDIDLHTGRSRERPANSCQQILDLAGPLAARMQSDYYYVNTSSNISLFPDVKQMYCNLVDERCGQKGWMRVAEVNASTGICPENFTIRFADRALKVCCGNKTTPGRRRGRLYTIIFPINVPFTRVAAFVEGYQFGTPDAFSRRNAYGMDGIAFYLASSHSNIKSLLWAYAAGVADKKNHADCPCSTIPGDQPRRRYSSDYHYCDTGNPGSISQRIWFTHRPLWTGNGCPATSSCCDPPDLPYFCRSGLRNTEKADRFIVEIRLSEDAHLEDIGISHLQIYVA